MIDEPDGSTEEKQRAQQTPAVQETTGNSNRDNPATPQQNSQQPWYASLFSWIKSDPSAFITATATAVIAAFTIVLVCVSSRQWRAMIAGNDNATSALHTTERPSVSLGDTEGKLAEFQKLPDGRWTVLMYFQNSGRSPAFNFLANFHTSLKRDGLDRHLFRFRKNVGYMEEGDRGSANIPANSLYKKYLSPESELSEEEHQLVTDPAKSNLLFIFGTMEYCDQFGTFHCDGFQMLYNPALKNFITTSVGRGECVTPVAPEGWHAISVCVQPDEQSKRGGEPYYEAPPWTPPPNYHPIDKAWASGPMPWPTAVPIGSP